ncbi:hypothetical protein PINS_up000926 [Pythium insidiosum]|nr:hypothetical protein PINS_up000926 [Pythium insidiosum]
MATTGAHWLNRLAKENPSLAVWRGPRLGRFAVASTDIAPGDRVLQAPAFAVVVSDRVVRQRCHWCLARLKRKAFQCGACEFARYCSRACLDADSPVHDPQCAALALLQQQQQQQSPTSSAVDRETLRLVLAVLATEQHVFAASASRAVLQSLHVPPVAAQRLQAQQTAALQLVALIASLCPGLQQRSTPDHVLATLQRVQSNAHPILLRVDDGDDMDASVCGVGLFPEAAMTLNHSCRPNVVPTFDAATRTLQFHVVERLSAGSVIEYSYVADLLEPAQRRRRTLRDGFGFDCRCHRCATEHPNHNAEEDNDEEQGLLECLVKLSHASTPPTLERDVASRYDGLLHRRVDLRFAWELMVLRNAARRQDWRAVLHAADSLLEIWRDQRLPEKYPTTWTLHRQIQVAALRMGDMTRAREAQASAVAVRGVCWGK